MGARRLGQDEQYLTVREILSEASTLADGALSREPNDFYRFGYATLGSISKVPTGFCNHSTTQTVQLRAWLTILLEILPKINSSLRERPCLPTTRVPYSVSSRSAKMHAAIDGQ